MINLNLENQEQVNIEDNTEDIILASEALDDCLIEINEFNKALTNTLAIRDALSTGIISTELLESVFNISVDKIIALESMSADKRVSLGKKLLDRLSSYLREIGNNKGVVIRKVREVKEYVSKNRSKPIKQSDNLYLIGIKTNELEDAVKKIESVARNTNKDNVNENIGVLSSIVENACKKGGERGHALMHPAHTSDGMTLEHAFHYVDSYYSIYLKAFNLMYSLQTMLQTIDNKIGSHNTDKSGVKEELFHQFDITAKTKLTKSISLIKRTISAIYVCLMKWCKAILATK